MKKNLLFTLVALFCIIQLQGQVSFSNEKEFFHADMSSSSSLTTGDLNLDGIEDIVCTGRNRDVVLWYEGLPTGGFSESRVISKDDKAPEYTSVADLDGDNDMDIIAACSGNGKLVWYENDGNGNFGSKQIITSALNYVDWVQAGDIDKDGYQDIISYDILNSQLVWFKNNGSGSFSSPAVITDSLQCSKTSVAVNDLDQDGDLDAVFLIYSNSMESMYWVENQGNGLFGAKQLISSNLNYGTHLIIADIDNDNDKDIFTKDNNTNVMEWFENNGSEVFSKNVISTNLQLTGEIYFSDIDKDGDMDLSIISRNSNSGTDSILVYKNNGAGNFSFHTKLFMSQVFDIHDIDADHDGEKDLLTLTQSGLLAWSKNDGNGFYGQKNEISVAFGPTIDFLFADMDGDGIKDPVTALFSRGTIAFFPNLGYGIFKEPVIITDSVRGVDDIELLDMDSDNDIDVVIASRLDQNIMWIENLGNGQFSELKVIYSYSAEMNDVSVQDMDDDGDIDILSVSWTGKSIMYHENIGNMNFTTTIISNQIVGPIEVHAIKINSDEDYDVLVRYTNCGIGQIYWYENMGNGVFGTGQKINSYDLDAPYLNYADMDNDNDIDIVVNVSHQYRVLMYRNDGNGNFYKKTLISPISLFSKPYLADIDDDGLKDMIFPKTGQISWYKNQGNYSYTEYTIVDSVNNASELIIADLQDDQDLDVLFSNNHKYSLSWCENLTFLGVNKQKISDHTFLHPNPTSDIVYLHEVSEAESIQVYNMSGEKIIDRNLSCDNNCSVDLSGFSKGIYIFVIKTTTDVIQSKVVKM